MKKLYIASLVALMATSLVQQANAQSKFDAAAQALVNTAASGTEQLRSTASLLNVKAPDELQRMTFIVNCRPDFNIALAEETGVNIEPLTECGFIATGTIDAISRMAELDGILSVGANYRRSAALNAARAATHVDDVHNGIGLDRPYKGDGVIVGLMDTGLDPAHVNFSDEDGWPRAQRYWLFSGSKGDYTEYTNEDMPYAPTDDPKESHGTHVLGIIAGSYNSASEKIALVEDGRVHVKGGVYIPYYGMAPNADIVIAAGELYDANILQAVRNGINYARQEGKPLVFNLSLGANSGPHDGTDAMTRQLDEFGKQAIICISAGNEGNDALAVRKTLTEESHEVRTIVVGNKATGTIDVWASDSRPVKVSWVIYDSALGSDVATFTADNSDPDKTTVFGSTSNTDPKFKEYFKGTLAVTPKLDPNNKRWNVMTYASVEPQKTQNRYRLALVVEGEPGQHIDIYGNASTTFTDDYIPEFDNGQYDGTINGMACGHNLIAVGSYATTTSWGMLSGTMRTLYNTNGIGNISKFSSWGTLLDGRELPHICAPGEVLHSSISSHYAERSEKNNLSASAPGIVRSTDYWDAMQGTSMSSPAAAGIIALWLEANPYLTRDQVIETLKHTAIRDENVTKSENPVAWGAGKIDAYEGLKYAARLSAIDLAESDNDDDKAMMVSTGEGTIEVFVAGASTLNITLYNIQGATVIKAHSDTDTAHLSTSGIQPGVYILAADTSSGRRTRRIVIR